MRPCPAAWPGLLSINVQDGLGICPVPHPETFSLRRPGEEGPVNMVTAFSAARLAAAFLEAEPSGRQGPGAPAERSAVILCPSASQARLCRAALEDLGKAGLRVLAGEPGDFDGFPPVSLAILDTALGAPHSSHPWARGAYGAKALLQALALAGGALVLLGPEERLAGLPADGPLGALYRASADKVHSRADRAPLAGTPFLEALERASESVFCAIPAGGGDWWAAAARGLHAALRRRVKVTLYAGLPQDGGGDSRREDSLRSLRLSGAQVLLAEGFPGFAAAVDGRRFFWGDPAPPVPSKAWQAPRSFDAPRASALLEEILQIPLVALKLGPGSPKSCPLCGWPFLLVNLRRPRGFGDANPLKLGCPNPSCPGSRDPRPLDERWPYASPPACREDGATPYERRRIGKKEFWICPNHPAADGACPRSRVIPGDPAK
jgi:hypothetical protein